jgi:hypothetical protein
VAALKFVFDGNPQHGLAVLKAHLDFVRQLGLTLKKRRFLKETYPFTKGNRYKGLIAVEYFLLRRRKVEID